MSLPGLRVSIRKVAHSSKTYWSSPSGSEFIVCVASDGRKSTQTTIVDPSFKENFKTPYPTERYSQMLKLIPGCFIGTPSSLLPLLRIIVFELTLTFRAHNSDLPPWRTMKALSSKWLSDSCSDEAISATAFLKAASKSQQDHAATSPISRQHEIVPNRSWSHMSTEDIRTVSTDPSLSAADDSSLFALSEPSICSEDQAATDSQAIFIVGFHIKQQVHD